jgi:hypothetical protein
MKRAFALIVTLFGTTYLCAQPSYAPITCSKVKDMGGKVLQQGTITFTAEDNSGIPITMQGVLIAPVTCSITAGVCEAQSDGSTCKVIDAKAANPMLCYHVTLRNTVLNESIPTPGQICAQPTGDSWSYDDYTSKKSTVTTVEATPVETFNDQINAAQQTRGRGDNGIINSLTECASMAHVCQILAPNLYAQTEAQPWSGANLLNAGLSGLAVSIGPKATDPIGCVTDYRFGGPQVICNQGEPNPYGTSRFNTAASFTQHVTSIPNGLSPNIVGGLTVNSLFWSGGRDSYLEEVYQFGLQNRMWSFTNGVRQASVNGLKCFAPGDCIPLVASGYSVGSAAAQNEGTDLHFRLGEIGNVVQATLNSKLCGSTGCTLRTTQTQGVTGSYGDSLPFIDLTNAHSTGYIAQISAGVIIGSSDAAWDSTYGVTSAVTTTTAALDNGSSSVNTFPQSNATILVASTTGFSISSTKLACLFSDSDHKWFCAHITAIGSKTLTLDVAQYPAASGSTIAQGGLTGYGFSPDAEGFDPANRDGQSTYSDSVPSQKVRTVFPIVSNARGNIVTIYTPNGVGAGWNNRAYASMGGSGGSCSVTVSDGAVTSATATGGSGYISTSRPPQLVISGITYATKPQIYVSGISNGALTSASIYHAGDGISGTPACAVVTSNPYHIYAQALVLDTYNHATGKNDGSAIVTTPIAGTFNTGDTLELAHYFNFTNIGLQIAQNFYQPASSHQAESIEIGGSFSHNDYAKLILNTNIPQSYSGYPGASSHAIGLGQLFTPRGFVLSGAFATGLEKTTPAFGDWQRNGAVFVDCWDSNTHTSNCTPWTGFYPVLSVANGASSYDVLSYSHANSAWKWTAGATGRNGAGATTSLSLDPVNGLVYSGPEPAQFRALADTGLKSKTLVGTDSNGNFIDASSVAFGTNVPAWLRYLGDGSDGANTSARGTMAGEYYYTNFTVPYGNTVTVGAVEGSKGLIVHATGTCTIAGTITATGNSVIGDAWLGGTGGGGGGGTAAGNASAALHESFAGLTTSSGGAAGGGAGSTHAGYPNNSSIRAALGGGNGFDLLNTGGSTGGQGGNSGGAGGAGGSVVVLICGRIVGTDGTHTGSISANGIAGTAASANNTGAGGGGGGGILVLSSRASVSTWPTLSVTGGAGGACGSFTGCGAGGAGHDGWTAKFNNW